MCNLKFKTWKLSRTQAAKKTVVTQKCFPRGFQYFQLDLLSRLSLPLSTFSFPTLEPQPLWSDIWIIIASHLTSAHVCYICWRPKTKWSKPVFLLLQKKMQCDLFSFRIATKTKILVIWFLIQADVMRQAKISF